MSRIASCMILVLAVTAGGSAYAQESRPESVEPTADGAEATSPQSDTVQSLLKQLRRERRVAERRSLLSSIASIDDRNERRALVEAVHTARHDDETRAILAALASMKSDGQSALVWIAITTRDARVHGTATRLAGTTAQDESVEVIRRAIISGTDDERGRASRLAVLLDLPELIPTLVDELVERRTVRLPPDSRSLFSYSPIAQAIVAGESFRGSGGASYPAGIIGAFDGVQLFGVHRAIHEPYGTRRYARYQSVLRTDREEVHRSLMMLTRLHVDESPPDFLFDQAAWREWFHAQIRKTADASNS